MADHIKIVETTIRALKILSETNEGMGVRELSRMLEVNKSTCHRMLLTLEDNGIVNYDNSNQKYQPSLGMLQIANKTAEHNNLINTALPHMTRLRDLTNETIALYVRILDYRIVVAKVESNLDLRWSPVIGNAYPLHRGAASKVFLTCESDELFQQVLENFSEDKDKDKFVQEIREAKLNQYATSVNEIELGGTGIAAPIYDKEDNLAAVVSIYGLSSRIDNKMLGSFIEEIKQTAMNITKGLTLTLKH
ncbi:IclR family transcriptional regulator [Alteribacillus iranensis]|uniref:DNA-binding transcriptional regulator, IclR family n=1 Tax=Alteribacillus iranensis TaxID=930128 RepID=A0A1I2B917_9BACI|nr:IclR family transcriptional regulator [Alteribacillus iranensis]SFE52631.1 DNA-binding transcriptional regulator, IclR family [Alteribacillus iranensis]